MPFNDILVYLDRTNHSGERLEVAVRLAQRIKAGVIGLRVEVHPHIPETFRASIRPAALEAQAAAIAQDTAAIEARFRAATDKAGLKGEFWLEVEGGVERVCLRSRHACLTVLGGMVGDHEEELPSDHLMHEVLLHSGRPVLVVPDAGASGPVGTKVAVAWNGSREAARAVADALPILAAADVVTVIAARPPQAGAGIDSLAELLRHLSRNGIDARMLVKPDQGGDVGAVLMEAAAEAGADLLVMGGYGHSRMREVVLGGATRHVIRNSTIPVFMSH